ncbi:MAG TPA: alpha/beta hydrolase [Roseiflexaceae bacterium]|nr:alpha/beta hydrolase [Roseiflexaceae bacterium]
MVHGLSVSSRYMVPTARLLARHRQIYAPDLPGFGKSGHPSTVLDIPALADALEGWLRILGVDRAVMVGNSMGCQIIAELAVRHPGRIERAVLVGPTVDRRGRTFLEQARRLLVNIPLEPLSSILTQGRDYWAAGLRRTIVTFRHALASPIEERLATTNFPILIVRGEYDPIAPQRWCEELASLVPDGQFTTIPHAPHAANYDAPMALARIVLEFLHAPPHARPHALLSTEPEESAKQRHA